MKRKPWNEIDFNVCIVINETIASLEQKIENLKMCRLRIQSKYELPECEQPHVKSQD